MTYSPEAKPASVHLLLRNLALVSCFQLIKRDLDLHNSSYNTELLLEDVQVTDVQSFRSIYSTSVLLSTMWSLSSEENFGFYTMRGRTTITLNEE